MALPNVTIQYQNGGLGLVSNPDDRVVGLVVNGNAGQGLPPGQISQIFGRASFAGFAGAVYPAFAADYYQQMSDFYKVAGEGAEIFVLFADPAISTATLFSNGQISALMDAAGGRLNVVGITRFLAEEPGDSVSAEGIDTDTLSAMDEAQAFANAFAAINQPCRFVLDGRHFTGDTVGLHDLRTNTYNRVAVNMAAIRAGARNSAMGFLLGRIASIPVNRNIGRVKDGSTLTSEAYFTDGQAISISPVSPAQAVHTKGYIFLRKFANKAGFYWNDDHMATNDTDDYYSLSNGRTIDKAARIAYATFIEELLDEVLVDEKGKVLKTTLKQYQAKIERAIGLTMAANGEISDVSAFIDPNQDIIATSKLVVDLRVTPTGTNRVITVKLGLSNPNVA